MGIPVHSSAYSFSVVCTPIPYNYVEHKYVLNGRQGTRIRIFKDSRTGCIRIYFRCIYQCPFESLGHIR